MLLFDDNEVRSGSVHERIPLAVLLHLLLGQFSHNAQLLFLPPKLSRRFTELYLARNHCGHRLSQVFDLQEMSCAVDFIQLLQSRFSSSRRTYSERMSLRMRPLTLGGTLMLYPAFHNRLLMKSKMGFFNGVDDLYNKMITPPCSMAFDS
jgi:hypothetical protein